MPSSSRSGISRHLRIKKGRSTGPRYSEDTRRTGTPVAQQSKLSIIAAAMDLPEREDEGPDFERLLSKLDNDHDPDPIIMVHFGQKGVLSDRGAERLGRSLLGAKARNAGRRFSIIGMCPYFMTENASRYSSLLEFFATGQYYHAGLYQDAAWNAPEPGMAAAMAHILTAMLANPEQPANLTISGLSLSKQSLYLANQFLEVTLVDCRMEAPLQQLQPMVVPRDTAEPSPARGSRLRLASNNDWSGILQAQATLKTNVTSLFLMVNDPIVGRLDLSGLVGFVATQPNGMDLNLHFQRSGQMNADARVEHILEDTLTQCPRGVHSLWINIDAAPAPLIREKQFPRLLELVSDSALTRFDIRAERANSVLSPAQVQQITVITQRNGVIAAYLQSTNLVYANDDEDRPKHQYLLSHALSQAAVHPALFPHFYEFVRNHSNELPGGRDRQAPAAAAAPPPP
jgi:hypothetical protein